MIDPEVLEKLKERYSSLHPLIFHRSTERANDGGQLFEILEGFPKDYPVVWDEELQCWGTAYDMFQKNGFAE